MLHTLLQHGVETTVDRSQKNSRIINWIQNGRTTDPAEQLELRSQYGSGETSGQVTKSGSLSSSGLGSEEITQVENSSTELKTLKRPSEDSGLHA